MYLSSYFDYCENIGLFAGQYAEKEAVRLFLHDLCRHRSIAHSTPDEVHEILALSGFHRICSLWPQNRHAAPAAHNYPLITGTTTGAMGGATVGPDSGDDLLPRSVRTK